MPVKFLSQEWTNELQDRLNASESFKKSVVGVAAKLQQVVTGPDGESRYWIQIQDGGVGMGQGDIEAPDATVTQDYDTAVGLATSQVNAMSAFMTGRLKIAGNMGMLMQLQAAISELGHAMQEMDVDY